MKRIIHIINNLHSGGAENMLYKIIKYSDKKKYYHQILLLRDEGILEEKIKAEGVEVHSLDLKPLNFLRSLRLAKSIAKNFDVIDTWLYHSDLFGFIIGKVLKKKIIWNIRHSNLQEEFNKKSTLLIVKINSFLSKYADCITFNSTEALDNHKKARYSTKRAKIIYNGFDIDVFKKSSSDRLSIRNTLKIRQDDIVFITVGRWNIQKDYYTLIESLYSLKKSKIKYKMLMVGYELDYNNKELVDLINKNSLNNNIILLGTRKDIPQLLSSADIYISSSLGESFSNTIGEAMASELPCIVTDVGHSKLLVGSCGEVVNAGDSKGLKDAIIKIISSSDLEMIGKQARESILKNYDIKKIVKSYERTYEI